MKQFEKCVGFLHVSDKSGTSLDKYGCRTPFKHPLHAGKQNGFLKKILHQFEKCHFDNIFENNAVLGAKRLEPRSGPSYVGPDLGSSLFAIFFKNWYISIPQLNALNTHTNFVTSIPSTIVGQSFEKLQDDSNKWSHYRAW